MKKPPKSSAPMHPAIFITGFTLLGILFSLQEWTNLRHAGYSISPMTEFEAWGAQYFLWGVLCWGLWRLSGSFVQKAGVLQMITIVLPVSLAAVLIEEITWVALFPKIPLNRPPMLYWPRVALNVKDDLAESLAIFWCAFFFVRGFGYYQQLREKETVAAQLEAQLANARIAALRMQLNPHFLFNTMNSISSLMRSDIDAADAMLEQLSSLLRMTLERRDAQLIPLHEEIEFTETYLAMQDRRFAGRVTRTLSVDSQLYDILVPAMILQPIIENAYVHGLSQLDHGGELSIDVCKDAERVRITVTNSGRGLKPAADRQSSGCCVGLENVKDRLRLHYRESCSFSIHELDSGRVQVSLSFPQQLSTCSAESITRFGA